MIDVVLAQPGEASINHPISFSSRKLSTTEKNYTTKEVEGLAMVYVVQKFRHYLLGIHFKMYTDHSTLKYLVNKRVLGGNIFWWLLLFQEFDFEFIVKLGRLNLGPDHLSRIKSGGEPVNLDDSLLDAQLFAIKMFDDNYRDIIHFFITSYAPDELTTT